LIEALSRSTGKAVSIASVRLDIFKGLVIKDLKVSDQDIVILASKDVSCRFLIMPIFKKEVIVSTLKFDSPRILVERMPDNSINIAELFFKKKATLMDGKFTLTVSKIIISKGSITFKDDTLIPVFMKEIKNTDIEIKSQLPDKVAFNADFEVPCEMPILVKSSGEYSILKKEFSARIEAKDFYAMEFIRYLDGKRFNVPDGRMDILAIFDAKGDVIDASIDMSSMGLKFSQEKITADLACALKAKIKYNFANKELIYTGSVAVKNMAVSNLDFIGNIYDIRGSADFNDKRFSSDEMTATVLGLPVRAKAVIEDLRNPALDIDVESALTLNALEDILKKSFNINMPLDMAGEGRLKLKLQYKLPITEPPIVRGSLDIASATLKPEQINAPLEDAAGRIDFTHNQLIWSGISFRYNNTDYRASGAITNFGKPGIQLELNSDRLSINTLLAVNGKLITLSNLAGRYGDYEFSVQGDIDTTEPEKTIADIAGTLKFELAEDKEPFKSFRDKFKNLKPSGIVSAQFNLKGNLNDVVRSAIDAEVKSDSLSLFGLKMHGLSMAFTHRNGITNIKTIRSSLYGGRIDLNGVVDLVSKDRPYQINADVKGVKIELLKKDTAFREMDISGTVQTHFGVKGFSDDISRLSAWGKINIADGRLWQLNLFRGMGALLFRSDFSNIIFREGSCDFYVKDKIAFTNNLVMKSDLLNLYGAMKAGFDNSISASLKAEFTDEGIDASRTSNIAGTIERYTVIEVKGSLKDPKCRIRPDLTNVILDIADRYFTQ